jgi:predicted metal-dependent peptidase
MEADAEVHKQYPYSNQMGKIKFHTFYGRGGTNAAPWLKALEDGKFDAGVILTDGYFGHDLTRPRLPILWALTEGGYKCEDFNESVKFGKKIKLEQAEKR